MSQHYYVSRHESRPVSVLMGWDRPLQYYFLVVEYLDVSEDAPDSERYLYSNLDDAAADAARLDYFTDILGSLGVTVPGDMIRAVADDGLSNVGNRRVDWVFCDGDEG